MTQKEAQARGKPSGLRQVCGSREPIIKDGHARPKKQTRILIELIPDEIKLGVWLERSFSSLRQCGVSGLTPILRAWVQPRNL